MDALLALDGVTGGTLGSKKKDPEVVAITRRRPPPPPKTSPQTSKSRAHDQKADPEAKALHTLLSALKQSDEVLPQQDVIIPRDPRIAATRRTSARKRPPTTSRVVLKVEPKVHQNKPNTQPSRPVSVPSVPCKPVMNPGEAKGAPSKPQQFKRKASAGWKMMRQAPQKRHVDEMRGSYLRPPGPPPLRILPMRVPKQNGWVSNIIVHPRDRRRFKNRFDHRFINSKDPYIYNSSHAMLTRRRSRSPSPFRNRFAMQMRRGRSLGGFRCVNGGRGRSSRVRNPNGNYGRKRG